MEFACSCGYPLIQSVLFQVAQLQEQLASSMPTDSASERPQEAGVSRGLLRIMRECMIVSIFLAKAASL